MYDLSIFLSSVHPEMVDFGSGQDHFDFESSGVSALCRGFQNRENNGLG